MRYLICFILFLGASESFSQQVGESSSPPDSYWAQEEVFLHTDKPVYVIGEPIWFSAYCLDKFFHFPSSLSKVLYVELINREGRTVLQEKIALDAGIGNGSLYLPAGIPSDVYSLSAYTTWMQNEGPEAFFYQPVCIINPGIPPTLGQQVTGPAEEKKAISPPISPLSISPLHAQVSHREKVEFTLKGLPEDTGKAHLSISIHKTDRGLSFPRKNLPETLSAAPSKAPPSPEIPIDWESFSFPAEPQTQLIRGRIEESAITEIPLFLNFPGKSIEMYAITPDSYGNFTVGISPHTPSGELLIWSPEKDLDASDITLFPPFSPTHEIPQLPTFPDSTWRDLLESYLYNAQVSHLYRDSMVIDQKSTYTQAFYGVPRYSYLLDDYTRFPELEEVFLEYIRYALKRRVEGKRYVFIWDEYTNMAAMGNSIPFKEPALVLIDGVPIKDPEILWDFDVLSIEQADLVTKKYYLTDHTFFGIASFFTYERNFGGQNLPQGFFRARYQGLQGEQNFTAPSYPSSSEQDRPTPDFRSTLYWNPHLTTDSQEITLECWSSDDEGTYKIEVQGITETGIPLYGESYFEVKRSL